MPGVYAELAPVPGHGATNAAVVVDADGSTVVDTLMAVSYTHLTLPTNREV